VCKRIHPKDAFSPEELRQSISFRRCKNSLRHLEICDHRSVTLADIVAVCNHLSRRARGRPGIQHTARLACPVIVAKGENDVKKHKTTYEILQEGPKNDFAAHDTEPPTLVIVVPDDRSPPYLSVEQHYVIDRAPTRRQLSSARAIDGEKRRLDLAAPVCNPKHECWRRPRSRFDLVSDILRWGGIFWHEEDNEARSPLVSVRRLPLPRAYCSSCGPAFCSRRAWIEHHRFSEWQSEPHYNRDWSYCCTTKQFTPRHELWLHIEYSTQIPVASSAVWIDRSTASAAGNASTEPSNLADAMEFDLGQRDQGNWWGESGSAWYDTNYEHGIYEDAQVQRRDVLDLWEGLSEDVMRSTPFTSRRWESPNLRWRRKYGLSRCKCNTER
jgi:hypothetical protein